MRGRQVHLLSHFKVRSRLEGSTHYLILRPNKSIGLKTVEKSFCATVGCTFPNFVKQRKNSHWLQEESITQKIPQGFGRMASAE